MAERQDVPFAHVGEGLRAISALLVTGSEVQVLESLIDDASDRVLERAAKQASQLARLGAIGREQVERVYGIPWVLTGERRGYVTG